MKIELHPQFEFNKYDLGLAIVFQRENESKKYIRNCKIINYMFGIAFLWFAFSITLVIRKESDK